MSEMNIYQILSLLFGSGVFATLGSFIYSRIKKKNDKYEALQLGLQALLRSKLYEMYDKYTELGYAPIWARENFENVWQQYHNLGKNGVMDDIHNKFMLLPTEPPTEKEEK
jgi:hypothetical protein